MRMMRRARGRPLLLLLAVLLATAILPVAPVAAAGVWTTQPTSTSDRLLALSMVSGVEGIAVGETSAMQGYAAGSWQALAIFSPSEEHLNGVQSRGSYCWIVGAGGTIGRRYLEPWFDLVPSGTTADLYDVWFVDGSRGWAVGDGGAVLTSYDSGSHWAPEESGTTALLRGVSMTSVSEGWAVGDGVILHYSGGSWSPYVYGPIGAPNLNDIEMVSASEGWAVGDGGTILHYDGVTWSSQPSGTSQRLHGVSMVSASEGWAVGRSGTIVHYSGGVWSPVASGTGDHLYDVSMVSATEGWAVGDAGLVLHYLDTGPPDSGPEHGVSVSASAPSPTELSLTFSVTAGAAPEGGSITDSAIDFGLLAANSPRTGSHRLEIATNASNGYNVSAAEDRPLTSGGNVIPDVTGDNGDITESTAGAWESNLITGFGYTLANLLNTPAVFTTGYRQFADVSASEAPQDIMVGVDPTEADAAEVIYKLNVGPAQGQGTYANTVTYIATGNL